MARCTKDPKSAAKATPAPAAKAPARAKAGPTIDRQARLAALLDTEDFKKRRDDILPNDFIEPWFPTDSIVLDHVLGFEGGIHHRGRCVHLQGPEHTGKTTLAIEMAAAFQRHYDEPVWFWDYERTIKQPYAYSVGLSRSKRLTVFNQPSNVRESVRDTIKLLEADACRCFIFDSISMMYPDVDMDEFLKGKRDVDDKMVGEHARFMMDFFRLITPIAARKNALLLFINQSSTKILTNVKDQRQAKYAGYSPVNLDYDVKGGRAPKQFASYQIETTKGSAKEGSTDDKDQFLYASADDSTTLATSRNVLCNHIRVLKNKVTSGGYREADIYLRPGGGIDDWISVRAYARHYGMITFMGGKQGYRIGTEDNVITTYPTKADTIRGLVLEEDMSVLVPLRELVVKAIQADEQGFKFVPTAADRKLMGEEDGDEFFAESLPASDALLSEATEI